MRAVISRKYGIHAFIFKGIRYVNLFIYFVSSKCNLVSKKRVVRLEKEDLDDLLELGGKLLMAVVGAVREAMHLDVGDGADQILNLSEEHQRILVAVKHQDGTADLVDAGDERFDLDDLLAFEPIQHRLEGRHVPLP